MTAEFQAAESTVFAGVASVVASLPPSIAAGDYLLAALTIRSDRTFTIHGTWTTLANLTDGATGLRLVVLERVAGASEPTPTFAWTGGNSGGTVTVSRFTGQAAGTVVDVQTTATASLTAPAAVTTVADTLLVYVGAVRANASASMTAPAGYAQRVAAAGPGSSPFYAQVVATTPRATAGTAPAATGAFGATATQSAAVHLALRSAATVPDDDSSTISPAVTPPPPAYRFLYGDFVSGTLAGELPVEEASFGEVLNGPGSFQATIPLDPGLGPALTPGTLSPGRTTLYVERAGVIVWGGLLWTMEMDLEANAVRLAGEGFWSLVRLRTIQADLSYTGADQASIATGILDHLQGVSGGALGLTYVAPATGRLRDRTYLAQERKNAAEAIEQLAAVRDGFDFRIAARWSGSSIVREFILSYPATGRLTAWTLDPGTNMAMLRLRVDGKTMATTVHVKGAGEGDDAVTTTQTNAALLGVYPLMEDTVSVSGATEVETLVGHAQRRLDRGQAPTTVPDVALYTGQDVTLGAFVVGDVVTVRGSYGLLALDAPYRITAWSAKVDGNGFEEVGLTLAPLEVFTEA